MTELNLKEKHKKLIIRFQQKFDISDYGVMWISFLKGFVIGAILL
tara:strand:- start:895 stop:1029 length:135 start_codon:yes stop_codon:yes gene_type:complete